MEQPAFLVSVQRAVGRVEVEDDLLRGTAVRIKKQIDQQRLDGSAIRADPVIPRRLGLAQLQPVQGAFACQRRAVRPVCREFARQKAPSSATFGHRKQEKLRIPRRVTQGIGVRG